MTKEQSQVVKIVYSRFIESESEPIGWGDLDCNLELMDTLTDKELVQESEIKMFEAAQGTFRCAQDHDLSLCFAPFILEAAHAITDLYRETGELHPKNRYILTYFLSMSVMRLIYSS